MDWLGVVAVVLAAVVLGLLGLIVLAWRLGRRERRSQRPMLVHEIVPQVRTVDAGHREISLTRVSHERAFSDGLSAEPVDEEARRLIRGQQAALNHRERTNREKAAENRKEMEGGKERRLTRGQQAALNHRERTNRERAAENRKEMEDKKERRRLVAVRRGELKAYDKRVATAEEAYRSRLAAAEAALAQVEREGAARVKAADNALSKARETGRALLGGKPGQGTLAVWEHAIEVDGGVYPMTEKVRATVDQTGDVQRHTTYSTRPERRPAIVLSMIPYRMKRTGRTIVKQHTQVYDNRELYLLVEGDQFAASVTMDPRRLAQTHQLAAAINQAAKRSPMREQRRDAAIREATDAHRKAVAAVEAAVKDRRAAVDSAKASRVVEEAKADRAALDAAHAELEEFTRRQAEAADESDES